MDVCGCLLYFMFWRVPFFFEQQLILGPGLVSEMETRAANFSAMSAVVVPELLKKLMPLEIQPVDDSIATGIHLTWKVIEPAKRALPTVKQSAMIMHAL